MAYCTTCDKFGVGAPGVKCVRCQAAQVARHGPIGTSGGPSVGDGAGLARVAFYAVWAAFIVMAGLAFATVGFWSD